MRSRPKGLVAALASVALVATACGGDDSVDTSAAGAQANPVDLRMTVWTSSEDHLDMLNGIADAYVAEHADVASVTFESIPFDEYDNKLSVQLAGGNPPDLGWLLGDSAPQFIEAGALTDVSETMQTTDGYKFDDIAQGALEGWRDGEAIYGYPFSNSPEAVFYNADAWKNAGLQTPSELIESGEWTWEALAEAATTLSSGQQAGLVIRDFDFTTWTKLTGIFAAFGARPWDDGTCTFDSPEMKDALGFFHELVFDRQAHPGPGQSADFFAGEAATTVTQISRAGLLEDAGFEWGLVPLPAGPAGPRPVFGQAGVAVFANSPHAEQAAAFFAFLTNEENSQTLARYFPPPRKALLTADVLQEANPLLSAEQLENVVVDGVENGVTPAGHPNFSRLSETIRTDLDALWAPDASVDEATATICGDISPLL